MKRFVIVVSTAAFLFAACGDSNDDGGGVGSPATEEAELTVSAAASLTDAFTEIGQTFEQDNPGTTVSFNFGPSDGLATQINEGAPVDVFASASGTWMDAVEDQGPGAMGRTDFAKNRLAIIVPSGNPAGIEDITDLAEDDVRLVLAAEGVPVGDYAREILDHALISDAALANVVSNEEDVTADVEGDVETIEIPDDVNVIATYPIAVITGSQEADLAQRFVDFVLGGGQETLTDHGFLPA